MGSFAAFCLDLTASVSQNGTYTYNTINEPFSDNNPFSNSIGFNSAQQERIQAVFDANYATASVDWSANAASFQLALWEAGFEDETNGFDLENGIFGGTDIGSGTTIFDGATHYLSLAWEYINDSGPQKYALTYLESTGTRSQNLVTASPVPLPAAGLLLLGALGGLGVASRRRKASAEA